MNIERLIRAARETVDGVRHVRGATALCACGHIHRCKQDGQYLSWAGCKTCGDDHPLYSGTFALKAILDGPQKVSA